MKETEIAKYFIDYLSEYDLYFEVPTFNIDIVAKSGNILIACEVKTSLNFKVIEQAERNSPYFHYSYICVPLSRDMGFAVRICRMLGIGILVVDIKGKRDFKGTVMEWLRPRLNRSAHQLSKHVKLPEYSKRSIAGAPSSAGTTITAFKQTCDNITRYLRRHNGASLKEVYSAIETHYSSFSGAKACLYKWIDKGVITDFYIQNGNVYLTKDAIERNN